MAGTLVKTTCSYCGKPLEPELIGKKRYCKKCHAAYMRKNRPKHSELPEFVRNRINAKRRDRKRRQISPKQKWVIAQMKRGYIIRFSNKYFNTWSLMKYLDGGSFAYYQILKVTAEKLINIKAVVLDRTDKDQYQYYVLTDYGRTIK